MAFLTNSKCGARFKQILFTLSPFFGLSFFSWEITHSVYEKICTFTLILLLKIFFKKGNAPEKKCQTKS